MQARGITMKSSSISLLHLGERRTSGGAQPSGAGEAAAAQLGSDRAERGVLINLIDSPGHVDFCSEVQQSQHCVIVTSDHPTRHTAAAVLRWH
jgi:translation elongation factor EF-G